MFQKINVNGVTLQKFMTDLVKFYDINFLKTLYKLIKYINNPKIFIILRGSVFIFFKFLFFILPSKFSNFWKFFLINLSNRIQILSRKIYFLSRKVSKNSERFLKNSERLLFA